MAKKIALLESSSTFSMLMALIIKRMGFEVDCYKSYASFTESDVLSFDLIFIGDRLGDVSTSEAVKQIRLLTPDTIRIIVISTLSNNAIVKNIISMGASDYIFKPVHPKELHRVIFNNFEYPSGKRSNLRAKINIKGEIKINGEINSVLIQSLSRGGALIETEEPIPTGTEIEVKLPIELSCETINSVVIYNKKQNSMDLAGTAVTFIGIKNSDAKKIDRYLENDLILSAREMMSTISSSFIILPRQKPLASDKQMVNLQIN